MIHGHTKVAAVPIDGFKQSTSPKGLDNRQGSDNSTQSKLLLNTSWGNYFMPRSNLGWTQDGPCYEHHRGRPVVAQYCEPS